MRLLAASIINTEFSTAVLKITPLKSKFSNPLMRLPGEFVINASHSIKFGLTARKLDTNPSYKQFTKLNNLALLQENWGVLN
jgi:hypothetical protein